MAKEKIKSPTMRKKIPAESKEKSKKLRKPHPPYFQMIKDALVELKEKNGSSSYAIAKKIEEKYKSVIPDNFRKMLSLQLKNSVVKGKLVKIRASYKLLETKKMTTRQQEKQKKKKTVSVNKPEVVTKKKRLAKKKPRQPKSIKSPVTKKKVMKASAA